MSNAQSAITEGFEALSATLVALGVYTDDVAASLQAALNVSLVASNSLAPDAVTVSGPPLGPKQGETFEVADATIV